MARDRGPRTMAGAKEEAAAQGANEYPSSHLPGIRDHFADVGHLTWGLKDE